MCERACCRRKYKFNAHTASAACALRCTTQHRCTARHVVTHRPDKQRGSAFSTSSDDHHSSDPDDHVGHKYSLGPQARRQDPREGIPTRNAALEQRDGKRRLSLRENSLCITHTAFADEQAQWVHEQVPMPSKFQRTHTRRLNAWFFCTRRSITCYTYTIFTWTVHRLYITSTIA